MGETGKLSCGGSKGGKENLGKDGRTERKGWTKATTSRKILRLSNESAKAIEDLGDSECG